ncbi:MAG: PHP domain-containing protein [Oscillospiraceae bacterium]|nr:PHP domain-containing protein [Oscillospiraceae bacterium]
MAKVFYDFHLHSCLSPCADNDMTPYNIVNMAKYLGFDMIALTDHNSSLNCESAVKAGREAGLVVVPGMELCTMEESHVICLFPTVDDAMGFHQYVQENSLHMDNQPDIFGHQFLMNETDQILGEEPCLLINSANISIDSVVELTAQYHGAAFPAHIDRSSYSILASLGVVPEEANFSAVEISYDGDIELLQKTNPEITSMVHLQNSDAHYLEHMRDPLPWLDLEEVSAECLISVLQGKTDAQWSL